MARGEWYSNIIVIIHVNSKIWKRIVATGMIRDEGASLFATAMDSHGEKRHVQSRNMINVVETDHFAADTKLDCTNSHNGNFAIVCECHMTTGVCNIFVVSKVLAIVPQIM